MQFSILLKLIQVSALGFNYTNKILELALNKPLYPRSKSKLKSGFVNDQGETESDSALLLFQLHVFRKFENTNSMFESGKERIELLCC